MQEKGRKRKARKHRSEGGEGDYKSVKAREERKEREKIMEQKKIKKEEANVRCGRERARKKSRIYFKKALTVIKGKGETRRGREGR